MKTAAIIAGAGYVARELLGLLARHPQIVISEVVSNSQQKKQVSTFHNDPGIDENLRFTDKLTKKADVVFLCGGHGFSKVYLEENELPPETLIIDLSMDYRNNESWTYGLPDLHKGILTNKIANPGCFATAIQLGMMPLAGINKSDWHVTALTGSSGAGQQLQSTSHFSWRTDNVSVYKAFEHQHMLEINYHGNKIAKQQNGKLPAIHFTPMRAPFTRGIFASLYAETSLSDKEVFSYYSDFYQGSAFTKVCKGDADLKQVTGTNYCLLFPKVIDGKVHVISLIDNLLKGAAGQAVENMNLYFGLDQKAGLNLKPTFL